MVAKTVIDKAARHGGGGVYIFEGESVNAEWNAQKVEAKSLVKTSWKHLLTNPY